MRLDIHQVAEAVANMIRATVLPMTVSVNCSWSPQHKISELSYIPIVSVVPTTQDAKNSTRTKREKIFKIDIGIQKKLKVADNDEIDSIVFLSDAIADIFTPDCLNAYLAGTICLGPDHEPVVDVDHLDEHRVCTSLISVRFMEAK